MNLAKSRIFLKTHMHIQSNTLHHTHLNTQTQHLQAFTQNVNVHRENRQKGPFTLLPKKK